MAKVLLGFKGKQKIEVDMKKTDMDVKELARCPKCKSSHTVGHGYNVTKKGKFARRKCQQCGTTFYENKQEGGK